MVERKMLCLQGQRGPRCCCPFVKQEVREHLLGPLKSPGSGALLHVGLTQS